MPEGIPKAFPLDFTLVRATQCCLHNIFGPRRLILGLELTNSKDLFVDSVPLKVSIPTPTIKEIERRWLKALECKRKQAEDRAMRKSEKEAIP